MVPMLAIPGRRGACRPVYDALGQLPSPSPDPSNAVADVPAAAAFGKRLFSDARLSRNGAVSCATCHVPERQFGWHGGRQGIGDGRRRTMPVAATAHSPFLFWDGRRTASGPSPGPLEDGVEHGGNRLQQAGSRWPTTGVNTSPCSGARRSCRHGRPMPRRWAASAKKQAWSSLAPAQRDAINRVFANLGKAIAAYERTVAYGESRFDRYVEAVLAGDREGRRMLSAQEIKGLRLFLGKAQCATCHNGPLLTDRAFHNTGVPPGARRLPDPGRARPRQACWPTSSIAWGAIAMRRRSTAANCASWPQAGRTGGRLQDAGPAQRGLAGPLYAWRAARHPGCRDGALHAIAGRGGGTFRVVGGGGATPGTCVSA